MSQRPQACGGSGGEPTHTYERPARGSGGVVRPSVRAHCPGCAAYDVPLTPSGRVGEHAPVVAQ